MARTGLEWQGGGDGLVIWFFVFLIKRIKFPLSILTVIYLVKLTVGYKPYFSFMFWK